MFVVGISIQRKKYDERKHAYYASPLTRKRKAKGEHGSYQRYAKR
jgi:hypothetical protein